MPTPTTRPIRISPTLGTEQGSTVGTRGIYANDPVRGYVSAYDDNARIGQQRAGLVDLLRRPPLAVGRICVDGLRLPGRADALRLALHQFAISYF